MGGGVDRVVYVREMSRPSFATHVTRYSSLRTGARELLETTGRSAKQPIEIKRKEKAKEENQYPKCNMRFYGAPSGVFMWHARESAGGPRMGIVYDYCRRQPPPPVGLLSKEPR